MIGACPLDAAGENGLLTLSRSVGGFREPTLVRHASKRPWRDPFTPYGARPPRAGGAAATVAIAGRDTASGAGPQVLSAVTPGRSGAAPAGAEILWDTWGVPHIFAKDAPGL